MTYVKRTKRAKPNPEPGKLADSPLANDNKADTWIDENGLLAQWSAMPNASAIDIDLLDHRWLGKSGARSTQRRSHLKLARYRSIPGVNARIFSHIPSLANTKLAEIASMTTILCHRAAP